jgi:hypothetical protein
MNAFFRFVSALGLACLMGCGDRDGSMSSVSVLGNVEVQDDGDDDGGPAQTGGTKPVSLPAFREIGLYSTSSPFNQKIPTSAAVDPNSDAYIAKFALVGSLLLNLRQYSTTVFMADAQTPRYDVPLYCGEYWEIGINKLRDVPIPTWAEPTQDDPNEAPPQGCGEASGQDNNMVVLDLETRCEYDFWQMRIEDGRWVASFGNAISLDSNGVYPNGMSTRGSGLAFLGGHIWPDELQNGQINHALVFAYPHTRAGGPVAPATDSDGEAKASDALPEGARLQLDPGLDLDALGLTGAEKTVAQALQEYGMYLVDNGGENGIGLYLIDPRSVSVDPYVGILPDENFPALANIPLDKFRVLQLPSQDGAWRDKLQLTATGCNAFE